ncbi:HpcH/HpaI aldolase/citrate lyase family protein [Rhizobacter sp. P5_C2]
MTIKSWLYAPAMNTRLLLKASEVGADVAIFDLEDSVPPNQKVNARLALAEQLPVETDVKRCIRINATQTRDGIEDLLFIRDRQLQPDYLLIPKPRLEADAHLAHSIVRDTSPDTKIYLLIESVASLCELRTLDRLPAYVGGVFFGSADFSADMCVSPETTDFSWARQEVALHAHRLALQAIDTPYFNMQDDLGNEAHARQARSYGFAGKQAVHPRQIGTINDIFANRLDGLETIAQQIDRAKEGMDPTVQRFNAMAYGPPLVRLFDNLARQQSMSK